MPELPDLHVFSINLKKRILNRNIASVTVYDLRILQRSFPRKISTPKIFCEKLSGASIRDIAREGKELHFILSNGNSFSVHLMLSGKFSITGKDESAAGRTTASSDQGAAGFRPVAEKTGSKIIALHFDGDESFVISDYGGLCRVTLNPKVSKVPDALSAAFTFEYFLSTIKRNASRNIKDFLIDQKIVRGIGNAYVDEILWKADISPESVSGKIPEENLKGLYEAVPAVLNDAIQNILKISPDIISGEERSFLSVHNPHKKIAGDGSRIIKKTIVKKITYFTDRQKLFV